MTCNLKIGLTMTRLSMWHFYSVLTKFRKVYMFLHTCTLTKGITNTGNLGIHCLYNHSNTGKSLL